MGEADHHPAHVEEEPDRLVDEAEPEQGRVDEPLVGEQDQPPVGPHDHADHQGAEDHDGEDGAQARAPDPRVQGVRQRVPDGQGEGRHHGGEPERGPHDPVREGVREEGRVGPEGPDGQDPPVLERVEAVDEVHAERDDVQHQHEDERRREQQERDPAADPHRPAGPVASPSPAGPGVGGGTATAWAVSHPAATSVPTSKSGVPCW